MTDRLHAIDVALRICNIELHKELLEKVVKIIDLVNELGEEATVKDLKISTMTETAFRLAIKQTETLKGFPVFKQKITVKRSNILHLFDKYQQAMRYGIDYLKQNPNILQSDVKLINDVIDETN